MNKLLLSTLLGLGLTACTTPGEQGTAPQTSSSGQGSEAAAASDTTSQSNTKPAKLKPESQSVTTLDGKLILGKEEWVYVPDIEQSFKAKVDTGATTSSAAVVEMTPFERDGKQWVKFKIEHNGTVSRQISSPVVRWTKIMQEGSDKPQKHPVVTAWIEIGTMKQKVDFILTDRLEGDHAIILGQSFFRDIAVVDMNRNWVQPKKN